MAGHQLIDDYLATLAGRLPADAVDELSDGILDTWRSHLGRGLVGEDAARAAIADFGTPDQVIAAFVAQAPGRRTALLLLATGPVVGVCWGTSLMAARAWTRSVPTPAAALFGLTLLVVVATLAIAATSRRSYRRTRLAVVGGLGVLALDTALVVAVFAVPVFVPPMAVAVAVSLTRIGLTLRRLPGMCGR